MNGKRELRVFPMELEVRAATDDAPARIVGYAAVFNSWSEDLGGFVERIMPGAFKKTIQEADVRALWNHNPDYVLGRTKSGTLALSEDQHGLRMEITPPDTQFGRDFMESMARGDVDQSSFGFRVIEGKEEWEKPPAESSDRLWKRTVLEVRLFDVSPVTFPAYAQTEAHLRSLGVDVYIPEPPQGGHSGDDDSSDDDGGRQGSRAIATMRKRLELAEVEI